MVTAYGPDSENLLLHLKCVIENKNHKLQFMVLYRWYLGSRFCSWCMFSLKNKASCGIFAHRMS